MSASNIQLGTATEEEILNVCGSYQLDGINLFEKVFPVGSLFFNINNVNPFDLIGFGTWEHIPDKFLLAVGDTYATTYTTGGYANISVPSHTHNIPGGTSGKRSATHTHNITYYRRNGGKGGGTHKGPQENGTNKTVTLASAGAHTHSVAATNTNGTNDGVDAGTEDNFPPYFTIKVWRRTA